MAVFERAQLLRQCRLRDVQPSCGTADAAFRGNCVKSPQVLMVDGQAWLPLSPIHIPVCAQPVCNILVKAAPIGPVYIPHMAKVLVIAAGILHSSA